MTSPSATMMDGEAWETFQTGFDEVQDILDQNRVLIEEINHNHESKVPESLTRNVPLIKRLNGNISKVVDLYATLSCNMVKDVTETDEIFLDDSGVINTYVSGSQKRLRIA